MKREPVITNDGSASLFVPELDEHYHSIYGALAESMHVFIAKGLDLFANKQEVQVLEVGFGTALNTMLTYLQATKHNQNIQYSTIEKFPLAEEEWLNLNYAELVEGWEQPVFEQLHKAPWNEKAPIKDGFVLEKLQADLLDFHSTNRYDLIYFDAFAPNKQPELWAIAVFENMYQLTDNGGVLVTYCAKGAVRRSLQAAGFEVERIEGPPGKREMLRARKFL